MAPPRRSRGQRDYVFTWNNPPSNDAPMALLEGQSIHYAVWQLEVGSNETPHLQGYVIFQNQRRLVSQRGGGVLAIQPPNREAGSNPIHWEPRSKNSTPYHAMKYCMKKDDTYRAGPWEINSDNRPIQRGHKRAIHEVYNKYVSQGATETHIYSEDWVLWAQTERVLKAHELLKLKKRKRPALRRVEIHVGASGCGKTTYAQRVALTHSVFWVTGPNTSGGPVWWNGYAGHDVVVLDEFHGWLKFNELLKMFNPDAPVDVRVCGGTLPLLCKRLIITTTTEPIDWYRGVFERQPGRREEFQRRLDENVKIVRYGAAGITTQRRGRYYGQQRVLQPVTLSDDES